MGGSKTSKKDDKNIFFIIIGVIGIILVVVGIIFLLNSKNKDNSGGVKNKLEAIYKKYADVDSYQYTAKGKSDKGDVTIEAIVSDVSSVGTISSKAKVGNEEVEKKFKFDVVDNRYEQSVKIDGNWYTSQVSDSIDFPIDVSKVDATKMLKIVSDHLLKADDKNQYQLSVEEGEDFILSTQFITNGAFEEALLNGAKVTFSYNLNKKKSEIKDVNICFGDCKKNNLNVTFSNIKK